MPQIQKQMSISTGDIDRTDAHLLSLLQENARTSQHDLARAVGLSAPAVADRLRKLEERGVIREFTAVVDPRAVGYDITVFIGVGMTGSRHYGHFRGRIGEIPEIQECHAVTGEASHLLKARLENTAALESLLAEIQGWPGVQWTTTSIVLSTVKETSALPISASSEPTDVEAAVAAGTAEFLRVPFRHHH
ncbi:MAG: Lrp/AsnC family transcriptional regulator [Gemmatimonadota bacterium]|nr:Lrp/AsnC family transcriptional regulator [Gemmatimonadota bacterium]